MKVSGTVERWDIFELELNGPSAGNPFQDVELSAQFSQGERVFRPHGFFDGEGVYRVRFMPDTEGEWTYLTHSNCPELDGLSGAFFCTPPREGNHGPVRVRNTWYLAYEDGSPYFQMGTTCYAWVHQGDAMEEQTLATLASAPFNKLRMCVFPKHYAYNENEPELNPFEGQPPQVWDFSRFYPPFWRHLERRVGQLRDLGIEADIILFHPYDRWGYAEMPAEVDNGYLRYVVARLAAYRNVWWSFANEYDLMKAKTMADWDRFFGIVQACDPHQHLRGIHNCREFYDHTKPWVTHCSIQSSDFDHMPEWRATYRKPILYDECRYEGNIPQNWGNITAREMVRRFWLGTLGGCYVGHGETYQHPEDILWWSKGGVLHGESPQRIAFLQQIVEQAPPFEELEPQPNPATGIRMTGKPSEFYLVYCLEAGAVALTLPGEAPYAVDAIDPWEMTVTPSGRVEPGGAQLTAPRGDWLFRLRACEK